MRQVYWDESVYYEFTAHEVDVLECATNDLHQCCLQGVAHVIAKHLYAQLGIPNIAIPLIERSWNESAHSLYGRFDLAYDGTSPPKLLEYNADTPTSLIEAAIIQWYWVEERFPGSDQFNSLHERLVAGWRGITSDRPHDVVHFVSMNGVEDLLTTMYLRDTAIQAGLETAQMTIRELGWYPAHQCFVDNANHPVSTCFKLYPWEWMWQDPFAVYLTGASLTRWIEPPWKLILSSKGILPILWDLFPHHPNLLEARYEPGVLRSYVKKPKFSREGANIEIIRAGQKLVCTADAGYGAEGYIYQTLAPATRFDGYTPVLGSWIVQGEAAGVGVRESDGAVTNNLSRFIPHRMV